MKELIVRNMPKSPVSEAYRSVRTNIQFANVDGKIKTILVTSATAGEGKTTTLCNIAMTFCDAGKKVLILDCDLRKPRIHKFFEISNVSGLTDILVKADTYHPYVYKGIHENLHIISSGKLPSNPSELLYSDAMKTLVTLLEKDYDYIFIDAPPVLPVTDAAVMAGYIHGVLLVCHTGKIEIDAAKRAKELLQTANANILGVILNKVSAKHQKYSSYYYYYYSHEEGEVEKADETND